MRHLFYTLATIIFFSSHTHAGDIVNDVRAGSDANGGYFEFGVGLNFLANTEAITLNSTVLLGGAYRYQRFFVEAFSPSISLNNGTVAGLTFGANLWRNHQWSVDLLGASTAGRPASRVSKIDFSKSEDPESDRDLVGRNSLYTGAGVRLTGYFGNTILQVRLVDDIYKQNGFTGSAKVGYSRQIKNWNYHGVIGGDYASKETGQYWYGVSAEEASTLFPQYDVRSSVTSYFVEAGASYPVRDNVVFRSVARYTQFDSQAKDSPLHEGDFRLRWNSSLSYVF